MLIDNGKIRITTMKPQVRLPHEGRVDIAREIPSAKEQVYRALTFFIVGS